MSDAIVWYAPEIFLAAMIVLIVLGAVTAAVALRKRRDEKRYFDHIEEVTL